MNMRMSKRSCTVVATVTALVAAACHDRSTAPLEATPHDLQFMFQPADGIDGVVLLSIVVVARDSRGGRDRGFSGRVTLRLAGGTLNGDTTVTAAGGIATFANVRVLGVKSSYTLIASAEDATVTPAISLPFSVSAPSQQIAFVATKGVYVTNADGSGVGALVQDTVAGSGLYGRPAWSPDGARIVFQKDSSIEIVKADGSGLKRVASGFDPAWSRDGTRIRFAKAVALGTEIDEVAADGSSMTQLAAWPLGFHPDFSAGSVDDGYRGDFGGRLTWSPDLSQVAFQRFMWGTPLFDLNDYGGVFTRLNVMNADGSGLRTVTPDSVASGTEWGAAWSPDGRRLAFVSAGLATIAADGSSPAMSVIGPTELLSDKIGSPSWSPDAKQIAVVVDESGAFSGSTIWIVSLDGTGGVRRLSNISNYINQAGYSSLIYNSLIHDLAWSPR
jgi:Tol biopolymer transport system component